MGEGLLYSKSSGG